MKIKKSFIIFAIIGLFTILLVGWFICWQSLPSKRIGETDFYIMESFASTKQGKPLNSLYYKHDSLSVYEGILMAGYPVHIMWNDKYIVCKNSNGDNTSIINYVVLVPNPSRLPEIPYDVNEFNSEKDYLCFLDQLGISESGMNYSDSHIPWINCFLP